MPRLMKSQSTHCLWEVKRKQREGSREDGAGRMEQGGWGRGVGEGRKIYTWDTLLFFCVLLTNIPR